MQADRLNNAGQPEVSILPSSASADTLRDQAAACRRLAAQSRTRAGRNGLNELGEHFDAQAEKIDPLSIRR